MRRSISCWLSRCSSSSWRWTPDGCCEPSPFITAISSKPGTANPAGNASQVDPDDEELWRTTPDQYLEKIFQVVLTLPPLDTGGYQQLLRSLVGTRPDQLAPTPNEPLSTQTDIPQPSSRPSVPVSPKRNKDGTGPHTVSLPPARSSSELTR